VFTARFGEAAGGRALATRIRLAASQTVVAIAALADGRFVRAEANVLVTVGGCTG
jgi:sulfur-oxidizing protein SoxY